MIPRTWWAGGGLQIFVTIWGEGVKLTSYNQNLEITKAQHAKTKK